MNTQDLYTGSSMGGSQMGGSMQHHGEDIADSTAMHLEHEAKRSTGMGALHWFTLASIGASITLFLAGKRDWAIFIGLWPPTIQALKASAQTQHSR